MTVTNALSIATTPTRALTTRLGELKEDADRQLANLETTLRHIDETKALLEEQGVIMRLDLGPVGNSAAHARRAQEADKTTTRSFELPRGIG